MRFGSGSPRAGCRACNSLFYARPAPAKRQGKIKRNCTKRVGDLREIHSTPWTGKASAISTPSPLSKVSSLLSKRNPLDTLDPQSVRYFHPLSKVSSLLSKRNPLDTLDSPHRRRSRRRARHAAAPRCGVRPPLSEVGIVGGEYKIGEYNGSERCQPALGTAAVDTPPRQRGGWLAQLLVCYSSFFICLPDPPAPPGRCRARPRLSATTRSRQPPPACASSMGARRCWLDTPLPEGV